MNTKFWYLIVICALNAITFLGCVTTKTVYLTSEPDGAEVRVSSDQGLQNFIIGKTPLTHKFTFGTQGPSMFNLDFSLKGYETETATIKKDDYITSVDVELKREMVREVQRFVPVISKDVGFTIEPRFVRAWIEDIEREGMAASSIVRLGQNQSILGMDISPDGKTIVFSLAELVKDIDRKEKKVANLRSIHTRGGGIAQITSGQWFDVYPSYDGDGDYLLFSSDRLRKSRPDIFRISSEKNTGIAVVRQTSEGYNLAPSVSQNGVIAFIYKPIYRGGISGSEQVWTLGGTNQYPTQLREGSMPSISPDGTQIAFIGPDKQLWKVPVNGQNPVQLTSSLSPEGKSHPTWSPDGKYILFASDEGKDSRDVANYDIWMIREDGTNLRQLTTNGSVDDFPVVSPDQQYIYFVSNRGFKEGIWRIPFPISN